MCALGAVEPHDLTACALLGAVPFITVTPCRSHTQLHFLVVVSGQLSSPTNVTRKCGHLTHRRVIELSSPTSHNAPSLYRRPLVRRRRVYPIAGPTPSIRSGHALPVQTCRVHFPNLLAHRRQTRLEKVVGDVSTLGEREASA